MELFSLDAGFQPEELVAGYESLIWAERYATSGDFQAIFPNISSAVKALPRESYVTLRDSTVPMKVETHEILKPKNAASSIKVTGRSCEACWLELRASVRDPANLVDASSLLKAWTVAATKESDAAYVAMRAVFGDESRNLNGFNIFPGISAAVDPINDPIPQLSLTAPLDFKVVDWNATTDFPPSTSTTTGTMVLRSGNTYISKSLTPNINKPPESSPTYWDPYPVSGAVPSGAAKLYDIPAGNLYATVLELVTTNHHGIKATRSLNPTDTRVGIEIYNGADLTDQVRFDARFDRGEIDDATYLLSNIGSTNVGYVYGSNGSQKVLKTAGPEPAGLNRRVLLVNQLSEPTANSADTRKARGLIELYKNNATALFGGEVAVQVAAGYNKTYFLGDIIKLVGEYGLSQNVRVAEFIRSEDATGEKAFPTFEAVT